MKAAFARRRSAVPIRLLALAGVLFLNHATPPAAEAQTARLTGRVTDAQGAVLRGVVVIASPPAPAATATAVSDDAGEYGLALAPGAYIVTFTMPGFEPQQHEDVRLTAESPRVLDVTLTLGAIAEQVDVVGVTPLRGSGVSRDRVAAAISVIDGGDLAARGSASMADALQERLGSVSLEGSTTNLFQPTLRFRGFTASPLLGLPQGIAVYQNGVRINEPFGDTVQFDLFPQFAVDQVQLSAGADPTYGLNALGGALALELKNGFDHTGFPRRGVRRIVRALHRHRRVRRQPRRVGVLRGCDALLGNGMARRLSVRGHAGLRRRRIPRRIGGTRASASPMPTPT